MPDPLEALPNEIWTICMEMAIDGQVSGPLDYLLVSTTWERLLLDTPSLWTQIYIQNTEDEMARISAFLHLSKMSPLYVDVMTVLPTTDSMKFIAYNISRVREISIRPGPSHATSELHAEEWKRAASSHLARLSYNLLPSDLASTSCYGISLRENGHLYYRVVLVHLTIIKVERNYQPSIPASPNSFDTETYFSIWEEHMASTIHRSAEEDSRARTSSIAAIGGWTSYAPRHGAIGIAIPSFVQLLKDKDRSVRSTTIDALCKFTAHAELLGAVRHTIPSFVKMLEHEHFGGRSAAVSVLENLGRHDGHRETLRLTIPSIVKLLEHKNFGGRQAAISILERLAGDDEIDDTLRLTIPSIIKLLEHESSGIRSSAALLLGRLAEHDKLREALILAVPSLIELLERNEAGVRSEGISLLGEITKHSDFCSTLQRAIPSIIDLCGDGDYGDPDEEFGPRRGAYEARCNATSLLEVLVKHGGGNAHGGVTPVTLVELLGHRNMDLRSIAVLHIQMLIMDVEHPGTQRPSLLTLLEDSNLDNAQSASSLLQLILEHGIFHEMLGFRIPSLVKLLANHDMHVGPMARSLLVKMAEYDVFLPRLGAEISSLIKLQNDHDPDVQRTASCLLGRLTEYDQSQLQVTSLSQDESQDVLRREMPSRRTVFGRVTRSLLDKPRGR